MIFFPDCFSILDYKNCTELRENNSSEWGNAIYHRGMCINDPNELSILKQNYTQYYGVCHA